MTAQLDLARAINEGHVRSGRDHALRRSVQLAREDERARRRTARRQRSK